MQKQTSYQQLQPEDRITIARMRQRGIGVRAIARTLERAPSTIARELARNINASKDYGSHHAKLRAAACRHHARGSGKLHVQSVCWTRARKWHAMLTLPPKLAYVSISATCIALAAGHLQKYQRPASAAPAKGNGLVHR